MIEVGDIITLTSEFDLNPLDLVITRNGKNIEFTVKDLGNNTFEITLKECTL